MARKRKRSRKKVNSVGFMTSVGALSTAWNYALGGGQGVEQLKQGNVGGFITEVRNNITEGGLDRAIKVNAPLVAGLVAQMVLGRRNPGITIGKTRFKVF